MRYYLIVFIFLLCLTNQSFAQVDCSDAEVIECYVGSSSFNYYSSTIGEGNQILNYNCEVDYTYSGPDKRFYLPYWPGVDIAQLTIVLKDHSEDLDLFVGFGCNTDCYDHSTNSNTTNDTVQVQVIGGGATIFIQVDGFDGAESDFTLEIFAPCNEIYNNWDAFCNSSNITNWSCNDGTISDWLIEPTFWPYPKQKEVYRCDEITYYQYPFLEKKYKFNTTENGSLDVALTEYNDHHIFLYECILFSYFDPVSGIFYTLETAHCLAGGDAEIHLQNLPAGDYYLVVDAKTEGGYYELDIHTVHCPYNNCYCSPVPGNQIRCDGFESYTVDNGVVNQSGYWDYYSNGAGDAYVTDNNPYTGQKSLLIDDIEDSDVAFDLGNPGQGKYRLEWWTSIVSKGDVELYHYHDPNGGNAPNNRAAVISFDENGLGYFTPGVQTNVATFQYPQNSYFKCVFIIDTYENTAELWINGSFIYTWIFSQSNINEPSLDIDALDFYYSLGTFYVDDICFTQVSCATVECDQSYYEPVCVRGIEYQNSCYASCAGYTEHEWTYGSCNDYCSDCGQCYYYNYDQAENQKVYFYNNYCEETNVTYDWTFHNTNGEEAIVSFLNNSNEHSQNPICYFPIPGTYEVCQYVNSEGNNRIMGNSNQSVFYCCYTITISGTPCNSIPNPHIDYTYNGEGFNFTLLDQSEQNTDYYWEFPFEAYNINENDHQFYCELPEGCYTICGYVINSCGISSVCVTVCSNSSSCNSLPPTIGTIDPIINGQNVYFSGIPSNADEYIWEFPEGEGEYFLGGQGQPDMEYQFYHPGEYKVCLKLRYGCHTICVCFTIKIGCCYDPCWIYYPHSGWWDYVPVDQTAYFSANISDEQNALVEWDFGDGTTGFGANPTHAYLSGGSYYVCCTVTNYFGCSYTKYRWIQIPSTPCNTENYPTSGYTFTVNNLSLNLTNTSLDGTSYAWDFGDGSNYSNETNPTYTYDAPGVYVVCLTTINECGMSTCCYIIEIGTPCNYNFYGLDIQLDDTETQIGVSGIPSDYQEVQIDYGNGDIQFFNGGNIPDYTYSVDGIYLICIHVDMGCYSFTFCKTIKVNFCNVPPPVCGFTYTQQNSSSGNIQFSNTSTNATSFAWNFADGSPIVSLENPTHVFNPGSYSVCLTATNECASDIFCATIVVDQVSNDPPWTAPESTSKSHTIIIPSDVESEIAGLSLSVGDQISVWYQNGNNTTLGGLATFQTGGTAISAVGNDAVAPMKNGFNEQETFVFKVWKKNLNQVFDVSTIFDPVDGVLITHTDKFATNGISRVKSITASQSNSLSIELRQGWNLISSYIIPENTDMKAVFADIKDQTIIVKNSIGQVYIPSSDLNLIGNWDVRYGYQVKVTENVTLEISGTKVNPNEMPVPLSRTWQIISYLCEDESRMKDELNSILDKTILVKNGADIFIPGTPIGENICMMPGKGYWIKTSSPENTSLQYPCLGTCTTLIQARSENTNLLNLNTGHTATLIIDTLEMNGISINSKIKVLNQNDQLVGSGIYKGQKMAIPIWGTDETDPYSYGANFGDSLRLEVDGASIFFESTIYQTNSIWHARRKHHLNELAYTIQPNPASDRFTIVFKHSLLQNGYLQIFDLKGQVVYQMEVANMQSSIELSKAQLNAPVGMYLVMIKSGEEFSTQKLIVQ